jgi:hypothetical protein
MSRELYAHINTEGLVPLLREHIMENYNSVTDAMVDSAVEKFRTNYAFNCPALTERIKLANPDIMDILYASEYADFAATAAGSEEAQQQMTNLIEEAMREQEQGATAPSAIKEEDEALSDGEGNPYDDDDYEEV